MTITAKVIADSRALDHDFRLTTLLLRYPRMIHAEFLTHRVFSRNASSSRAIPVGRLIDDVIADTAMPTHWGKNQRGMQADEECNEKVMLDRHGADHPTSREEAWLQARDAAVDMAKRFSAAGYHKQIVNRLLEPFSHINVVVSSTHWENFFALRDHPDAQPEIRILAQAIKKAIEESESKLLRFGEWHLPFVLDEEREMYHVDVLKKISTARCARTSYMTHEGTEPSVEKDLELYERLVGSTPLHASPAEHQATPDRLVYRPFLGFVWEHPELHGNFSGWNQHRKYLPNEYVED